MKIELSDEQLNVVYQALAAQPFQTVAPVIAELQKQVNELQQEPEPEGEHDG